MTKTRFGLRGMVCVGVLLGAAGQASAATDDMPLGALTAPPIGYIDLCERAPSYCVQTPYASQSQLDGVRRWAGQTRWSVIFGQRMGIQNPAVGRADALAATAATDAGNDNLPADAARPDLSEPAVRTGAVVRASGGTRPWDLTRTPVDARPGEPAPARAPVATPAPEAKVEDWKPPRFFTDIGMARLNEVNRTVNRNIRPVNDQAAFGKADLWVVPTGPRAVGDCEDYVLAKRQALIEAGVPIEALSIAVVETHRKEIHAVLLVATPDGEVVLDNLTPWIVSWRDASYRWMQRQAPGSALTWVQPAIAVASAR